MTDLTARQRPGGRDRAVRLAASGVTKHFWMDGQPEPIVALVDVSLEVADGEGGRRLRLDPVRAGGQAERTGAAQGPRAGRVVAVLDHVRAPVRDSVSASLDGVALPSVALPAAGARLALGSGSVALALALSGDNLNGSMSWHSSNVRWTRAASDSTTRPSGHPPTLGSAAWGRDLLWRTVSRLHDVSMEVRLSGRASAPSLGVRSNVGQAVAQALKQELGAELSRQEQQVRARVDQLVGQQVQAARTQAADAQTKLQDALAAKRAEVDSTRKELEGQLTALTKKLPLKIP